MTAWDYTTAYPGAPMVGPPLPRALYPPDAKPGHTPSADGPDIEAVKRGVSRGGRWPWGVFDDSYSNGFSHGKTGGNVADSGMAGFQRQMKIQPTGWMGAETYNALRSALIPDGLPHAGEHLLDEYAVLLLEQAAKQFANASTVRVREAALVEARKWIGTKEDPYGSNQVLFTDWYGAVGPWCLIFASYCFETGAQTLAKDSPSFVQGSYYAYCPYAVDDARNQRRGLSVTTNPEPGDLCFYDWERDGVFDHVGIVESGTSFSWTDIEGNTSTSSDSNGGEVQRRSRSADDANVLFVRVAEPD